MWSVGCFLFRFCAFTWNDSGMKSCIRSRLAATYPSHWKVWTCDLSWLKTVHPKSPPMIFCQLFATTEQQEVWDSFIFVQIRALQIILLFSLWANPYMSCSSLYLIFSPFTILLCCRWTLHSLLSECDQRPVVWVWWPVCYRGTWDSGAECRGLCAVL